MSDKPRETKVSVEYATAVGPDGKPTILIPLPPGTTNPQVTIMTPGHPEGCKCDECCKNVVTAINNLAAKFDVTATNIAVYMASIVTLGSIVAIQVTINVVAKYGLGVTFAWLVAATLLSEGDPEAVELPMLLLTIELMLWAAASILNHLRMVVSVAARVGAMAIVVITALHAIYTAPVLLGHFCR